MNLEATVAIDRYLNKPFSVPINENCLKNTLIWEPLHEADSDQFLQHDTKPEATERSEAARNNGAGRHLRIASGVR
jgi:hypothetical protein